MMRQLPSLRLRLREATADLHETLHRAEPFAAIAQGRMDLTRYPAILRLLHRYHHGMHPLCVRGAAALDAPELADAHAARIALLEDDLAAFGAGAAPSSQSAPFGDAFCAGALYTVQGSTLGGKVIFAQLGRLLPGDAGRHFFKGLDADGRYWQTLCARLEKLDGHFEELEAGANHAFAQFAVLLKEITREPA